MYTLFKFGFNQTETLGIPTYGNIYAKQKHPRCKKSEAKSEAPVSSYSYTQLKSVISGRGQAPSCLLVTM